LTIDDNNPEYYGATDCRFDVWIESRTLLAYTLTDTRAYYYKTRDPHNVVGFRNTSHGAAGRK